MVNQGMIQQLRFELLLPATIKGFICFLRYARLLCTLYPSYFGIFSDYSLFFKHILVDYYSFVCFW